MDPIVDFRATTATTAVSKFMSRVYGWMTFGLLITAVVSYVVGNDPALTESLLGGGKGMMFMLLYLGLAFWMSMGINRMSVGTATFCFILFSFVTGIVLSSIFLIYSLGTIAQVFVVTAGMFGALAFYGITTKKNLTAMGSAMYAGLWGVIIAMFVNWFLKSPVLDYALSVVCVVVFSGLTAWNNQTLRDFARKGEVESDMSHKLAIFGALTLYLDFINLFISLLRVFGGGGRRRS